MKFLKMSFAVVCVLPVLFVSAAAPAEDSDNTLVLDENTREVMFVIGEQRVIGADDVASFSESVRGIIEVKIPKDGRKMILTAIKPGSMSLLLIDRMGKERTIAITVFSKEPGVIEAELRELLSEMDGLKYRRVGPRIYVDGYVSSDVDLDKVEQVAKTYAGQVACLAAVDLNAVRSRTNIRLDLTFVGLRRTSGYDTGISWPGALGASGVVSGSLDLITGSMSASYQIVDQALPSLELAARYGWARIRKRATVMTTSGNRATYEAGGEVNIAVAGSQAAELRSVSYGAKLIVLPRLAGSKGIIDLDVEAEVSDLTETTQSVPGRSISRVKTLVHLGLGQSILLGGLESESDSTSKTGLPGLSRIPILGFFFGTTDKRSEREEGAILITPTILDNVERDGKRRLEEVLKKFDEFKGKFK